MNKNYTVAGRLALKCLAIVISPFPWQLALLIELVSAGTEVEWTIKRDNKLLSAVQRALKALSDKTFNPSKKAFLFYVSYLCADYCEFDDTLLLEIAKLSERLEPDVRDTLINDFLACLKYEMRRHEQLYIIAVALAKQTLVLSDHDTKLKRHETILAHHEEKIKHLLSAPYECKLSHGHEATSTQLPLDASSAPPIYMRQLDPESTLTNMSNDGNRMSTPRLVCPFIGPSENPMHSASINTRVYDGKIVLPIICSNAERSIRSHLETSGSFHYNAAKYYLDIGSIPDAIEQFFAATYYYNELLPDSNARMLEICQSLASLLNQYQPEYPNLRMIYTYFLLLCESTVGSNHELTLTFRSILARASQ